jgi:hypothetical protein
VFDCVYFYFFSYKINSSKIKVKSVNITHNINFLLFSSFLFSVLVVVPQVKVSLVASSVVKQVFLQLVIIANAYDASRYVLCEIITQLDVVRLRLRSVELLRWLHYSQPEAELVSVELARSSSSLTLDEWFRSESFQA